MKKGLLILLAGLLLAVAGDAIVYRLGTRSARQLESSEQPELVWLQVEFHLSDAEFQRISSLHEAYLPQCAAMCQRIAAQTQALKSLLAATNQMTPEIEAAIAESARLRGECQRNMLRHFFEVSRTMPADAGKRYLAWVQEREFPDTMGMMGDK